ncbi:MAG: polymerase sigma factor RpoE [Polyangiaceae bacterium]|nr:polymerase sigma factor RpoE [Polyangiaceae bacterium]
MRPTFEAVYAETFPIVWRSARRLGVLPSAIDDVVQEVFVAVHRQLEQFEGRCAVKTWVFGILLRVVGNYRRTRRRKGAGRSTSSVVDDPDALVADQALGPLEQAQARQAALIVRELLETLPETHAAVFVMSQLEGMTAPEIAEATATNLNTVYSRLSAAKRDFSRALELRAARHKDPV